MYKQVIVVRNDLKMGKGKIATHVAHASLGSLRKANKKVVDSWETEGGKKVVLKAEDLKELRNMYKKAKAANLPSFLVRDAGLTQLRPGSITCLGIGPDDDKKIDRITGKLKLL